MPPAPAAAPVLVPANPNASHTTAAAIRAHFNGSDALYLAWSEVRHMHHGYYAVGASLDHDAMLDAMVDHAVDALQLPDAPRIADMGCGYGATANRIAHTVRGARIDGYTFVEEQVDYANAHAVPGVAVHRRDYRHTGAPDAAYDGVMFLESICYASGDDKADVIAEAARILRPGGRVLIADGFVLGQPDALVGLLLAWVAGGWAVGSFPHLTPFLAALDAAGFDDVRVERASLRIAPTVLQGQWLAVRREADRWWRGATWTDAEWAHLQSCVMGMWLGLCLWGFQYLVITARKAGTPD